MISRPPFKDFRKEARIGNYHGLHMLLRNPKVAETGYRIQPLTSFPKESITNCEVAPSKRQATPRLSVSRLRSRWRRCPDTWFRQLLCKFVVHKQLQEVMSFSLDRSGVNCYQNARFFVEP